MKLILVPPGLVGPMLAALRAEPSAELPSIGGMPVLVSRHCPPDTGYILNGEAMRPDCKCGHPASYHINFAHEGKPVPPGPPDYPRRENFCRHPTPRGFCACRNYEAVAPALVR